MQALTAREQLHKTCVAWVWEGDGSVGRVVLKVEEEDVG